MTDPAPTEPDQTYRIGAVSRLTGVPADTLRVWERRYHVVTPVRSDSGTRLYGSEDVGRLTLIKRLVDQGDAISSVANLTLEGLRERVRRADLQEQTAIPGEPCRVMIYGPYLADRLRHEVVELEGTEFIGFFASRKEFLEAASDDSPDVVILEFPTIQSEQVQEIGQLLAQSGAAGAILVYGCASRSTIARLDSSRIVPRRAPVDGAELRQWCLALHPRTRVAAQLPEGADIDLGTPPPPRRYADAELARIAAVTPSQLCECPRYLADLVSSLTAFETYSEECEIRNRDDAALHAYLQRCTAHARLLMETALARVVVAEGILPDPED